MACARAAAASAGVPLRAGGLRGELPGARDPEREAIVFHALWEARDGTRALALANATDRAQPVAWKAADGTWRKATVAANGLKLVAW